MKLLPVGMSAVDQLLRMARWRWTPFVGPVVGTTLFVLCLAWMVPDDFGTTGRHGARPSVGASLESGTPSQTASESTEMPSEHVATHAASESSGVTSHSQQRRRGFSPPLERMEPPVPVPTATSVTPPPPPGGPGMPGGPPGPPAPETAQAAGMPAPTAEPVPPPVVQ